MGEPRGLGVFVWVVLAEGKVFVRVELDEMVSPEGLASAWCRFGGGGAIRQLVGEGGLVTQGAL